MTIGILLFGVTTSSGLYARIEVLLRYVLGDNSKSKDKILTIYKWTYPILGLALVVIAVVNELPGVSVGYLQICPLLYYFRKYLSTSYS